MPACISQVSVDTKLYEGTILESIPKIKEGLGVRLAVVHLPASLMEVMVLASPLSIEASTKKARN